MHIWSNTQSVQSWTVSVIYPRTSKESSWIKLYPTQGEAEKVANQVMRDTSQMKAEDKPMITVEPTKVF